MKKKVIYRGGRMSGKSVLKIDNPDLTPLEALESVENLILPVIEDDDYCITRKLFLDYLNIIETALKELIDIKSGKIRLSVNSGENYVAVPKYQYEQDTKKLKALDVIREKQVSVADFIYACMCSAKDLKEYHNCDSNYEFAATCVGWGKEYLTKEEYELLKEVLL